MFSINYHIIHFPVIVSESQSLSLPALSSISYFHRHRGPTMLVTPARPSFVTRVPSFLQTTRQGMPDTPKIAIIMFLRSFATITIIMLMSLATLLLASPDALEVIVVSYSLTHLLTDLLSVSTDLTDVTLVSDDTY